ncbi:MAG: leucine-rich repeat protein [Bacilli bacterium]|jgi:uncharacterized repeat protein (TIGR02543 family)
MNKIKRIFFILFILMAFLLVACGKAEEDFGIISATGFKIDGTNLALEVSSLTDTFSFTGKIKVEEGVTWELYTDKKTTNKITSNEVNLIDGENILYLKVIKGKETKLYKVTITKSDTAENTLVFNANGGIGEMTSILLVENTSITLPKNTFTKEEATFIGWSTSKDGDVEYLDEASYTVTNKTSCTLYAKWEINTYKLTLSRNPILAGTVTGSGTKEYNSQVEITATTKSGYEFLGWYEGTDLISDNSTYTFTMPARNILYQAKWKANINTLSFDANTGEGEMESVTAETAKTISLPNNAFYKEGYNFLGWSTSKEGSVQYQNEGTYKMGPLESYTLYAKWEIASYTLNLTINNSNAGSVTGGGRILYNTEVEIKANANPGYTFLGWYEGNALVTQQSTYTFNMPGNYVHYEARWEATSNFGLTFNLKEDDTYEVVGYQGNPKDLYIGENYEGKAITSIASNAFSECMSLESIILSEGLLSIGERSFYGLTKLHEIVMPKSVTHMGYLAFGGCINVILYARVASQPSEWNSYWNNNGIPVYWGYIRKGETSELKYIVAQMGEDAPYSITITGYKETPSELVIPETIEGYPVKDIANLAFIGNKMTSLIIPETVTGIDSSAFYNCTKLKNVIIPSSVVYIGSSAFDFCSDLIIYAKAETKPAGWNNLWNVRTRTVVWGYVSHGVTLDGFEYGVSFIDSVYCITISGYEGSLTEIVIPETIENYPVAIISCYAFVNRIDLESITLPSTLTKIEKGAFSHCSGLTNIIIPSSVKNIDFLAFYGCTSLISAVISDGVQSIGESVFGNCTALTNIIIPLSVTFMDNYVFFNCKGLTINCRASIQPEGWSEYWNNDGGTVVWGYTG